MIEFGVLDLLAVFLGERRAELVEDLLVGVDQSLDAVLQAAQLALDDTEDAALLA